MASSQPTPPAHSSPERSILVVLALPWIGLSLFALGLLARALLSDGGERQLMLAIGCLLLVAGAVVAFALRRRWWGPLAASLERHGEALDELSGRRLSLWIALAAGAGLFAELTVIRIHASFFQFFAYFKNVTLLSCFLGLGLGYALGRRRAVGIPLFLPLLAAQVIFLHALRSLALAPILQNPVMEQLTMGYDQLGEWMDGVVVYGFLVFIFSATALTFVPLGQLASRLMERQEKLPAYGANLLGSLAGILAFHLLSSFWTSPPVWLAMSAVSLWPFLRRWRSLLAGAVATALALAALAMTPDSKRIDVYSPYQILTLSLERGVPPVIQVNNVFFQRMFDLGEEGPAAGPRRDTDDDGLPGDLHYALPYRAKPDPGRVLVVGAGTGNDVAAALRHGAAHVDAVEIDPAILAFGRALHPEAPYQDARVHAVVDDARRYIRYSQDRWDLVVYGLLDSHTLLAGQSGVRLDSYVYTVEAFREARSRLSDDGVLSVSFLVLRPELALKIYRMMEAAFDGEPPLVLAGRHAEMTFLHGPGLDRQSFVPPASFEERRASDWSHVEADVSTDDWPFLYMPERRYPQTYLAMVLLLLLLSGLVVRGFLGRAETVTSFSPPCFFLGAGFMLVETKAITELALAFGSTWQVVGLTIAAILSLAFLANLLVMRHGIPPAAPTYAALAVAVLLGLFVPKLVLGASTPLVDGLLMTAILTLPLFFSGFAFSSELARASSVGAAMASNLLGAMCGGFLEYNSMYFGFRSLYVLALLLYACAYLSSRRGRG